MDAKSKANFINSVASGNVIPCPTCGTSNDSGNKTCSTCGAELVKPEEIKDNTPAFEAAKEEVAAQPVKYVEPSNAFAQGLPSWSIEPPQVMVRRH